MTHDKLTHDNMAHDNMTWHDMHPPRLVVVVGAGCVEELVGPAGGIVVVVVIVWDALTQTQIPLSS